MYGELGIFQIKLVKGRLFQIHNWSNLFGIIYLWLVFFLPFKKEKGHNIGNYCEITFYLCYELSQISVFRHTQKTYDLKSVVTFFLCFLYPAHPGSLAVYPSSRRNSSLTEISSIIGSKHTVQPSSLRPSDQPAAIESLRPLRLSTTTSITPEKTKKHGDREKQMLSLLLLLLLMLLWRGSTKGTTKRKIYYADT